MLTPGARAKKFIRPRGSNAIFAARRGQLAPSPIKESQTTPDQKTPSRFGKAFSGDYTKFFGAKRTTKAMRGAVKAIKDILVETFAAAMSLGATVRNIVKQLSGLGAGRAGGGGLLGKLGMVGLIAAVVAGVAAIFGPKIKEVFESFKAGANQVFENVKGFLDGIEQKIISIYNFVRDLYNNKFKGLLQTYNDAVQAIADRTGIPLPKINLGAMKDIPAYTDQFPDGLNPLAGKTLDSVMGDVGNMLKGGLDNTTGVIGDLFNNMLSGLGLTDTANAISETLGAGTLFGPNRQLGSGGGLSTFFPGLRPKASTSTTSGTSTSVAGSTGEQNLAAFTSTMEASGNQNQADAFQVMLNRTADAQSGGGMKAYGITLGDQLTGREQFSPVSSAIYGVSADSAAAAKYGPISAALGSNPAERKQRLLQIASQPDGLQALERLFGGGSASDAAKILEDFKSGGVLSQTSRKDIGSMMSFRGYRSGAGDFHRGRGGNYFFGSGSKTGVFNQVSPSVEPAQPDPSQNQSSVPKLNEQQVSFLNNIGFTGGNQVAAAPRRPQPILTGNGSGTEGPDYSFFPPGSPDLFDVYGSQLGIA